MDCKTTQVSELSLKTDQTHGFFWFFSLETPGREGNGLFRFPSPTFRARTSTHGPEQGFFLLGLWLHMYIVTNGIYVPAAVAATWSSQRLAGVTGPKHKSDIRQ